MKRAYTASLLAFFAVLALVVLPSIADARFKRSGGFGSRGSKTWSQPRATPTAPRAATPIQQSRTPRSSLNRSGNVTKPGMFGGMSKGGFMAGLIGAGLLGALFGYGLSGGLGGLGAMLGLILQIGLLAFAAMFLFSWLRRRNDPAPATARSSGYGAAGNSPPSGLGMGRTGLSGNDGSGTGGPGMGAGSSRFDTQTKPLATKDEDFATFERLLSEVQEAYAREDMNTLERIATEEMCEYFREDIEDNQRQGHAIRISGIKLLQGDLSEAWKERDAEYATVAMRFSLTDAIVDRKTGKVIEGSLTEPQEMTEIWTFLRRPGGSPADWQLTAVQSEDNDQ